MDVDAAAEARGAQVVGDLGLVVELDRERVGGACAGDAVQRREFASQCDVGGRVAGVDGQAEVRGVALEEFDVHGVRVDGREQQGAGEKQVMR